MNVAVLLTVLLATPPAPGLAADTLRINLDHLDHLYKEVALGGREAAFIHIYAEAPDYEPIGVDGEGLACVDDVARALVIYSRDFHLNRRTSSLDRARRLRAFLEYLQHAEGTFYNFIWPDLSINRTGTTSRRSLGFWAARAVWGLGEYARVEPDRDLRETAIAVATRTIGALDHHVRARRNLYRSMGGQRLPAWFPGDSSCVAAIYLMGLTALHEADPEGASRRLPLMEQLARGLVACRTSRGPTFPYGGHLPYVKDPGIWHGWGNRMAQSLVLPGLPDLPWVLEARESARGEARTLVPMFLTTGWASHMDPVPDAREMIAYGIGPLVSLLVGLEHLDGGGEWARLAGLMSSWFTGNNLAHQRMYDPGTGRCYDGIEPARVNFNSGAESTIEALLALEDLSRVPGALPYHSARTVEQDAWVRSDRCPGDPAARPDPVAPSGSVPRADPAPPADSRTGSRQGPGCRAWIRVEAPGGTWWRPARARARFEIEGGRRLELIHDVASGTLSWDDAWVETGSGPTR